MLDAEVSIHIEQCKRIDDGYGGWFDANNGKHPEFRVAYKGDFGKSLFIHEYCHFLQWRDDPEFWKKYSHCKFYKAFKLKYINDSIQLEWDCEKRALNLIKTHSLDIDADLYIKHANIYLQHYHLLADNKSWAMKNIYPKKVLPFVSDEFHDLEYYFDRNNLHPKFCKILNKRFT